MSKKFEIIRPRSLNDSDFEEFEYLIRWIGNDGSDYILMFLDAEFNIRTRNNLINELDSDRIEVLIDSVKRNVTLTAADLSKNDLLIVGQIFENKYVTRLKKDGTTERYAPDSTSFKYRLLDYRYSVSFTLHLPDKPTWK